MPTAPIICGHFSHYRRAFSSQLLLRLWLFLPGPCRILHRTALPGTPLLQLCQCSRHFLFDRFSHLLLSYFLCQRHQLCRLFWRLSRCRLATDSERSPRPQRPGPQCRSWRVLFSAPCHSSHPPISQKLTAERGALKSCHAVSCMKAFSYNLTVKWGVSR